MSIDRRRTIMKQAYPTFIAVSGNDYLVYVPDLDIYTEGHSLTDAIEMARDAIGLKGIDLQDDGKDIPDRHAVSRTTLQYRLHPSPARLRRKA